MARVIWIMGLSILLTLTSTYYLLKSDNILLLMVDEIKSQIEQEEWEEAHTSVILMKKEFKNKKWKLQLLGDQEQYQGIEIEIDILIESIKEKSKIDSKTGLVQIKYYLTAIYSL